MSTGRQWRRAIKYSDIVEPQKSALKNIRAVWIFAIDPPGKVQQQFVKNLLQKSTVADSANAPLNFVNAPSRPCMHRRIDVPKRPLVGGKLPVGMHVPLAQKQDQLLFGKIRVDDRERNTVESQIPRRVPRIFPFVRHGDDVVVVEMSPILVSSVLPLFRRRRPGRIT